MPKDKMFVVEDNAYIGKALHRIARVTKQLLVSEPINDTGVTLRFYRPRLGALTDGMELVPYPKSSRSVAVKYTLKIVREED